LVDAYKELQNDIEDIIKDKSDRMGLHMMKKGLNVISLG
jgi:hypothetical protein